MLCVFLSLSSSFPPLCSFFSYVIYACLHTVSIYSFFFSVTVIFTSSLDALTMQTHSSFNHMYSFLPSPQLSIATEEFMGTWGQSTNPLCLVVKPDQNTKSHNSTITHTPMYYNTTAMARFEGQSTLRGLSQLCSLHFSVHRNTLSFFYVAIMQLFFRSMN